MRLAQSGRHIDRRPAEPAPAAEAGAPSSRRRDVRAWTAPLLGGLVLVTSLAVASFSAWLVLPYLVVMGLLLVDFLPKSLPDRIFRNGRVDTTNTVSADAAPETPLEAVEPPAGSDAPLETEEPPPSGEVETLGVESSDAPRPRKKSRSRSKRSRTVAAEPIPATWVQVAPGKFVRMEGPAAEAVPPPEVSPPEPFADEPTHATEVEPPPVDPPDESDAPSLDDAPFEAEPPEPIFEVVEDPAFEEPPLSAEFSEPEPFDAEDVPPDDPEPAFESRDEPELPDEVDAEPEPLASPTETEPTPENWSDEELERLTRPDADEPFDDERDAIEACRESDLHGAPPPFDEDDRSCVSIEVAASLDRRGFGRRVAAPRSRVRFRRNVRSTLARKPRGGIGRHGPNRKRPGRACPPRSPPRRVRRRA